MLCCSSQNKNFKAVLQKNPIEIKYPFNCSAILNYNQASRVSKQLF